jgi:hypothetical protein
VLNYVKHGDNFTFFTLSKAFFGLQMLNSDRTKNIIHDRGLNGGHAVAQAVSCWLPTAAARVRVYAEHVGFLVNKSALGHVFSEYFGFPCQLSFHQLLHHRNHPGLA